MKNRVGLADKHGPGLKALWFTVFLLVCLGAPLGLVSLGQRAPAVNVLWDWSNALGYFALALLVLLFVYAGRPRAFPPFSGRFFANLHRDFGYIALLLVVAHIVIMVCAEPLLLEHMKPTAPLHMLTGLAASIVMLLLVVMSLTFLRRRVWADYQRFRVFHAWLAVLVLPLVLIHVIGSGYYMNSIGKSVVCLAVTLLVVGLYLDKRFVHFRHSRTVTRLRDTSHYAHLVSYGTLLTAAIASLLLVLWAVRG